MSIPCKCPRLLLINQCKKQCLWLEKERKAVFQEGLIIKGKHRVSFQDLDQTHPYVSYKTPQFPLPAVNLPLYHWLNVLDRQVQGKEDPQQTPNALSLPERALLASVLPKAH